MRDLKLLQRLFAQFYQLYVKDFTRDIPIYLDLAAKHPNPVLEVGCRTGRVIGHLAAAGHEVLGIDTDRPMLELAVAHLRPWRERAHVVDFDLRHQPLAHSHRVALVTLFTFNTLIDVEEQRLFLRHLRRSLASPGVVALDLYCPLALVRPEEASDWREIERSCDGQQLTVRDRREMLTPLLERRTQVFQVEGGISGEFVSHRRYISPQQAANLLSEAGFENIQWVDRYDLSTALPVDAAARPSGPFLILAEV